jgi:hypothetical protein
MANTSESRFPRVLVITLVSVFLMSCSAPGPSEPRTLVNNFDKDAAGWQTYDYDGGRGDAKNSFYPLTWESTGGVNNSGYVWADDSRWRIDTPENPHSILAFIIYRRWVEEDELDLRDAELSVYLRGDGLDLKGAKCQFWALNAENGTRWHYSGRPFAVPEGDWGAKQSVTIENDESLWYRSWSRDPSNPATLDHVLSKCDSYGFSFIEFSEEVTGKIAMDELELRLSQRATNDSQRSYY